MTLQADLKDFHPAVAPAAAPPIEPLGRLQLLRAMRTNVLDAYGLPAYQELNLFTPFFGRRSFLTSDPAAIHHVLVQNPEKYARTVATQRILRPIIGDGLLLSEGDDWRFQRRTLAPAFAPRAMSIVARVSADLAGERVAAWRDLDLDRVNMLRLMQDLTLEIAAQALFSTTMSRRGERLRQLLDDYSVRVGRPYALDLLLPLSIPSPADLLRHYCGRRWLRFIAALLEQRSRAPRGEVDKDLYDLLTGAKDAGSGRQFTADELRDQFATMIIAGHETTALTLSWAFILIAGTPLLQDLVAIEAAHALALPLEAEITKRMPLTLAIIMETLRLFPPAFLIVREAIALDRVAGRRLLPGDIVSISPWLIHRHHRHWDAPGHFDPRRFLPDASPAPKWTYLPFGAGPRSCIGAQFALTEAVVVFGMTLANFRIEISTPEPIRPVAVVTTYPSPVPRFKLTPRTVRAERQDDQP